MKNQGVCEQTRKKSKYCNMTVIRYICYILWELFFNDLFCKSITYIHAYRTLWPFHAWFP